MATTKSRNGTRAENSTQPLDAGRSQQALQQRTQQQLASAAETTSRLLRGGEVWSQLQANALQRSGQTWREAAQRMRDAHSVLDLIGAQNQVLMNSFVQYFQFTQEFLEAAVALQQDASAQAAQAQGEAQEQQPEQASGGPTAESVVSSMMQTPMMQMPMVQAWQAMMRPMTAGMNGVSAGVGR
jgi:hypothetical protein